MWLHLACELAGPVDGYGMPSNSSVGRCLSLSLLRDDTTKQLMLARSPVEIALRTRQIYSSVVRNARDAREVARGQTVRSLVSSVEVNMGAALDVWVSS